MCVCVCVFAYTYMYLYVQIYIGMVEWSEITDPYHDGKPARISKQTYMCVYMSKCICIYTYVSVYACICTYKYTCVHIIYKNIQIRSGNVNDGSRSRRLTYQRPFFQHDAPLLARYSLNKSKTPVCIFCRSLLNYIRLFGRPFPQCDETHLARNT